MSGYLGAAPAPPRIAELWGLLKTRLDSAAMQAALGGAGRIFLITEDGAGEPQGSEAQQWGRLVIAPVRRAFGEPESGPGRDRMVPFMVRADAHPPGGVAAFDPTIALEAAHAEAFTLLHGWTPVGLTKASMDRPMWRHTDPQSLPLWDDDHGVWFMSAEYRGWLAPA